MPLQVSPTRFSDASGLSLRPATGPVRRQTFPRDGASIWDDRPVAGWRPHPRSRSLVRYQETSSELWRAPSCRGAIYCAPTDIHPEAESLNVSPETVLGRGMPWRSLGWARVKGSASARICLVEARRALVYWNPGSGTAAPFREGAGRGSEQTLRSSLTLTQDLAHC